jgi:hypothetical protein
MHPRRDKSNQKPIPRSAIHPSHSSSNPVMREQEMPILTLRPASLLCRFIRLLPCSLVPLLWIFSRSRTSTKLCVNLQPKNQAVFILFPGNTNMICVADQMKKKTSKAQWARVLLTCNRTRGCRRSHPRSSHAAGHVVCAPWSSRTRTRCRLCTPWTPSAPRLLRQPRV